MGGAERRQFLRVTLASAIQYRVLEEPGSARYEGILQDIGAGGLRFTAQQPMEQGTALELIIKLPMKDGSLTLTGEVVWAQPLKVDTEYGVRFVELSPDAQYELDELIQFLAKSGG